jgi:hypothetical protein
MQKLPESDNFYKIWQIMVKKFMCTRKALKAKEMEDGTVNRD